MDMMLQESTRGAVYIERIPDSKFQAAHPVKLEREVIARALRGVYVKSETSTLQTVFTNSGDQAVFRAFSDEDVDFLAPIIVKGLTNAASDQRIGFRVSHPAPLISHYKGGGAAIGSSDPIATPAMETTEANLYVYGTSLNLTLTKFRHRPEPPNTINMPNRRLPDDTGLKLVDVMFYPTEARRPDGYQPLKLLGEPMMTTLVIDYQLLAKLPAAMLIPPAPKEASQEKALKPAAQTGTTPPAPSPTDQKAVKDLETLKGELQELKKQMQQQQEEMDKLKEKPKKKSSTNGQ